VQVQIQVKSVQPQTARMACFIASSSKCEPMGGQASESECERVRERVRESVSQQVEERERAKEFWRARASARECERVQVQHEAACGNTTVIPRLLVYLCIELTACVHLQSDFLC